MKRSERKIYTRCIAIMAVYIISAVYFYTLPSQAHTAEIAENVPYLDGTVSGEEFTVEPSGTPETGQIREDTGISGMPCESPEQFARFLETYEQETSEEEAEVDGANPTVQESGSEVISASRTSEQSPVETVQGQEDTVIYSVNGETLNPDIQEYLYQRLSDYQLEWFMPYAVMIAYQESKFDIYAVNPSNHVDCGLFQFRSYYYPGQDIFNPYEQIDIFCELMGNRAKMGCDLYEMISRHMMSDYGEYNADYVSTVLSHERGLAVIGERIQKSADTRLRRIVRS